MRIKDYIFRDDGLIQKGISDVVSGRVLELKSERLRTEGIEQGKEGFSKEHDLFWIGMPLMNTFD